MNPELEQIRRDLESLTERFEKLQKSDRYIFERDIQLATGRKLLQSDGTAIFTVADGISFGATAGKLGFYGKTPVDKPDTVSNASGCNGDADTRVNQLIDRLQELGLIA